MPQPLFKRFTTYAGPTKGAFGFPGGRAVFNPQHPAAINCRLSFVMQGKGVRDLAYGAPSSAGGSPAMSNGFCGPQASYAGSAYHYFTGFPRVADANVTMAALLITPTIGSANTIFQSDLASATGTYQFNLGAGGSLAVKKIGSSAVAAVAALLSKTPYLVMVSVNGTTKTNFLSCNLLTGSIVVGSPGAAAGSAAASGGSFQIGNDGTSGSQPFTGEILAGMYAAQFMGQTTMEQWAKEVWVFWYQDL